MSQRPEHSGATGIYRSGVAARLTGIPVDTLRVWERRYALIEPRLSSGRQRLYSTDDIKRLALIKQLVDAGHAIGTLAPLGNETLAGMRDTALAMRSPGGAAEGHGVADNRRAARIVLVGPLLIAERVEKALSADWLRIVGSCADPYTATTTLTNIGADLVIIELPTLGPGEPALVDSIKAACGAATALVLYRYAPSSVIRSMSNAGHTVVRATADAHEIEAICLSLLRRPARVADQLLSKAAPADPPLPRFDAPALASLLDLSGVVTCECPRHLVDLVMNLGSFERYSAECASRSPEDAALHRDLQRISGLARSLMEDALQRVAVAEGFALPGAARDR